MNAITKVSRSEPVQSPRLGTEVREDGSLVISEQRLAQFGGGDAVRGRRELRLILDQDQQPPSSRGPENCPPSVRIAGPADEAAVLKLLLLDLSANAAHIAPIDEERILSHIQAGTHRRGGIVGVIDGPQRTPVAVVVLLPYQWWFSNGWYYQEIVNFVHPDHRRSRHADDLLDFCKWAMNLQSKGFGSTVYLLCGVLGAWRVRAKIALYRRKFSQVGAAFLHPAPPMQGN